MLISRAVIITLFIFIATYSSLNASNLNGNWHGEIKRDGFYWNVKLHISQYGEKHIVKVSVPDWAMFLLETDSVAFGDQTISFRTKWLTSRFEGRIFGDYLEGSWHFKDGPAKAQLYQTSETATELRSDPFELTADDGATLAGEVIFPVGDPPYPAMVLTHGSGPDTRDTAPYISKANLAALNGLAVLVYDKRGAGASTGDGAYKIERLAADARTMFRYLRKDPRIDSAKTGIGGISQGGWVAPKVAAEERDVAFVFVVSAAGLSPAEQNVFSMITRLQHSGFSASEIEQAKKGLRALYEFYRTGSAEQRAHAVSLINAPKANWAQSPVFRRLMFSGEGEIYEQINVADWATMFVDPPAWWREINVPVLGIWGAEDGNLPAGYSRDVIAAGLNFAGNNQYKLHVFPAAGHGISQESLREKDWPRAAPGYVEMMAAWFRSIADRP